MSVSSLPPPSSPGAADWLEVGLLAALGVLLFLFHSMRTKNHNATLHTPSPPPTSEAGEKEGEISGSSPSPKLERPPWRRGNNLVSRPTTSTLVGGEEKKDKIEIKKSDKMRCNWRELSSGSPPRPRSIVQSNDSQIQSEILASANGIFPGEMLKVLRERCSVMNPIHCSTALHRIALLSNLLPEVKEEVMARAEFSALLERSRSMIPLSGVQSLSNTAWALGKLQPGGGRENPLVKEIIGLILEHSLSKLDHFRPQNISNTLYALSKLGFKDSAFLEELCNHVCKRGVGEFKPQEVSNTVYALGRLSFFHEKILRLAGRHMKANVRHYNPQGVANILHAFSRLSFMDEEVLEAVAQFIPENFDQFGPFNITNTLRTLATLRYFHPNIFLPAGDYIGAHSSDFKTDELCSILHAFAQAEISHDKALKQIVCRLDAALPSLSPDKLYLALSSFKKLLQTRVNTHAQNLSLVSRLNSCETSDTDSDREAGEAWKEACGVFVEKARERVEKLGRGAGVNPQLVADAEKLFEMMKADEVSHASWRSQEGRGKENSERNVKKPSAATMRLDNPKACIPLGMRKGKKKCKK